MERVHPRAWYMTSFLFRSYRPGKNHGRANYAFTDRRFFIATPAWRTVRPYLLADIGEGITECQVQSWSVKPGDQVQQFDSICEVSSDKATVEITSRFDGIIKSLEYEEGDLAVVGQPLLHMDILDEESASELDRKQHSEGASFDEQHIPSRTSTVAPSQNVHERNRNEDMEDEEVPQSLPSAGLQSGNGQKLPALATPAVRHMLKAAGIELGDIEGTGKDGRVTKEDVQRHLSNVPENQPEPTRKALLASKAPADQIIALSTVESKMFRVMTESLKIPHFVYTNTVNVTSLQQVRKAFNANAKLAAVLHNDDDEIGKLSPLPFIAKALSQALLRFPKLNAHLDTTSNTSQQKLIVKGSHHFGIAVNSPIGLLVPVIRDVQDRSILSLAAEIRRLTNLARQGRLGSKHFEGATFTISNIGSIGGDAVSPIIVSPAVGILGIGRISAFPTYETDDSQQERIVKQEKMVLSWSADHRVIDGAMVASAAQLVSTFLQDVGNIALVTR